MRKIIIIRGPAGVGKSTIAKLLKKKLEDCLLFNIDMICSNMIGGHPRKSNVRFTAHELCYLATKKTPTKYIIFERLFLDQKDVEHIIKLFSKIKYKLIIITLKAPISRLFKQDSKRQGSLGSEDINRLYNLFSKSNFKTTGKIFEIRNNNAEKIVDEILLYLKKQ